MSSSRGQKRKQDQTEKPPTPVNLTVNITSSTIDKVTAQSSDNAEVSIIEEVKK
jgi:hypothetical protein